MQFENLFFANVYIILRYKALRETVFSWLDAPSVYSILNLAWRTLQLFKPVFHKAINFIHYFWQKLYSAYIYLQLIIP